jgi:uncharacterized protein YjiS (DUF1127 family)
MCAPHYLLDAPPPVRRTPSGAVDTEFYSQRARRARADALRALIECLGRCGLRAWGCVRTKWGQQTRRRELAALDARELKDIGIAQGDFDAIANGAFFRDPSRRPAARRRMLP